MTPVFCCGFECGVIGTTNIGQHWTTTAAASISTTTIRSGARSLRVNASAAVTGESCNTVLSSATFTLRLYIYFATLPDQLLDIAAFYNSSNTIIASARFQPSDSKIYAFTNSVTGLGATGVSVVTGQWYLIDLNVDATTSRQSNVQVNGVACGQSLGGAAATLTKFRIADSVLNTLSCDIFIDDVILSSANADYPIGAGHVNHFIPVSDGTHTATTTTIVKGTIAAPTAGGNVAAATDVFNWVNGVPLLGGATDNTRLVNQQTAGTTLYAEVKFGAATGITTPTTAPRAVEVITADREASTATCDFTAKLNDNGTEGVIIARGVVAGVITDRYATKQFATGPAGAWTAASSGAGGFNNIKARWGYASDATPDLYWRGIMIEAEFAEVVQNNNTTQFLMLMGAGT